jgi:Tol biopolymer transport system component
MDCPPPGRRRQFSFSLACLGFLAALVSHPGQAGTIRQVTDFRATRFGAYAIDDAGTNVFVSSSTNQLGTNPGHFFQIFRFDAATGLGQQLTSFPKGVSNLADTLSVSDDGQWLAFVSRSDLTGQNHDASPGC